ncbi:UNC93-like protein [Nymphon striatum]|nr:UNC93-like protein [Nymphon striatum]
MLDQLKRSGEKEEGIKDGNSKPTLKLLFETFRHLKNPQQILIIPLTIYSGVEQAFIRYDFTKAYIGCAWGIHNIGIVMICFGICNAATSFACGNIVRVFTRVPIFIFGALLHAMMVVTLFLWSPNLEEKALFYVIAGLWGAGDAVWQTQLSSLYGVLFAKDEEAAFSNYRLWESLGYVMVSAYHNYFCMRVKLYILVSLLVVGMIGYAIIETQVKARKKALNFTTLSKSDTDEVGSWKLDAKEICERNVTKLRIWFKTADKLTMAELRSMKSSDAELTNCNTNYAFDIDIIIPRDYSKTSGVLDANRNISVLSEKDKRLAKFKIIKNLLVVSFGFLLLFTAFNSTSNLQSSINIINGLGTASLSVINAALVVSCMFVPPYMIARLGCKYTLAISMLMFSSYFAANFYAHWYTLMPTSVILGLGAAPLFASQCTYLTEIANQYAVLVGETSESVVVKFFGVFFMFFQSGQIWGNLISAYVLKPNQNTSDIDNDPDILALCGINFCNVDSEKRGEKTNKNLDRPSDSKIYMLFGIYLGCALLAALFIFIMLDQLKRSGEKEEGIKDGNSKPTLKLMFETFRHLKNPQQILIIPLSIYSGVEQGFFRNDFTRAYISCAWGIHNIGIVMICFGICNAASSFAYGHIVRVFTRFPIFIFGALLHAMMVVILFLWSPNPEEKALFYVIAGLWGAGDAVWQTQLNSLYGVLFAKNEEAAFSNYRLWESIGFIMASAYHNYFCMRVKLYILVSFLVAGMIGYAIIEIQVKARKKSLK